MTAIMNIRRADPAATGDPDLSNPQQPWEVPAVTCVRVPDELLERVKSNGNVLDQQIARELRSLLRRNTYANPWQP